MLTCNRITKIYQSGIQQVKAVSNVTMEFSKGIHMIRGKSDSGKTTLLRMLGGLCSPTQGQVYFQKKPIYLLSEEEQSRLRREKFSFIFQFFELISEFHVYDNLALPLYIRKEKKIQERVKKIAEELSIENLLERMPKELSGGQQQKVAIGRAMVSGAEVIFADEPTGNLDDSSSIQIMDIFQKIKKEKTIIMVTHDLEMLKYADAIYYMKDGKLQKCEEDHDENGMEIN